MVQLSQVLYICFTHILDLFNGDNFVIKLSRENSALRAASQPLNVGDQLQNETKLLRMMLKDFIDRTSKGIIQSSSFLILTSCRLPLPMRDRTGFMQPKMPSIQLICLSFNGGLQDGSSWRWCSYPLHVGSSFDIFSSTRVTLKRFLGVMLWPQIILFPCITFSSGSSQYFFSQPPQDLLYRTPCFLFPTSYSVF